MGGEQEPIWQPITMLPTIAEMVTGMLDGAAEQQRLLSEAPAYRLDHPTLDRVQRVYSEGMSEHDVFEQQLARWRREHPDAEGLDALAENVARLRPEYQRVLELAEQQRGNTIEAMLGKSDIELGVEALRGTLPPDKR